MAHLRLPKWINWKLNPNILWWQSPVYDVIQFAGIDDICTFYGGFSYKRDMDILSIILQILPCSSSHFLEFHRFPLVLDKIEDIDVLPFFMHSIQNNWLIFLANTLNIDLPDLVKWKAMGTVELSRKKKDHEIQGERKVAWDKHLLFNTSHTKRPAIYIPMRWGT